MNNFSEDLKKVLLAGIGAVAVTAEKSKEVVEDLVKKGELTVEQGKVLNEELKHNVAEKLRKPVSVETVEKDLQNMDVEDLETLKAKIEEVRTVILPTLDDKRAILYIKKTGKTPKQYPRKPKEIKDKPLV